MRPSVPVTGILHVNFAHIIGYTKDSIFLHNGHLALILYFPEQVWRIENLELVPVEGRSVGHFYSGDCYLILYKYLVYNKIHYIIYIWQVSMQRKEQTG